MRLKASTGGNVIRNLASTFCLSNIRLSEKNINPNEGPYTCMSSELLFMCLLRSIGHGAMALRSSMYPCWHWDAAITARCHAAPSYHRYRAAILLKMPWHFQRQDATLPLSLNTRPPSTVRRWPPRDAVSLPPLRITCHATVALYAEATVRCVRAPAPPWARRFYRMPFSLWYCVSVLLWPPCRCATVSPHPRLPPQSFPCT